MWVLEGVEVYLNAFGYVVCLEGLDFESHGAACVGGRLGRRSELRLILLLSLLVRNEIIPNVMLVDMAMFWCSNRQYSLTLLITEMMKLDGYVYILHLMMQAELGGMLFRGPSVHKVSAPSPDDSIEGLNKQRYM